MPLLLLIVILAILVLMWITFSVVGMLITLLIAGLIGAAAEAIIPGRTPFGWLGAILAGLVGSWLGTLILSRANLPVGPSIAGIHILGAFVGALILVAIAKLVVGGTSRSPKF